MCKCKYCNKRFKNKKSLSNHVRWHNLPQYEKFKKIYRNKISKLNLGKNNGMWKGNDVKYKALHSWIKRNKKKPTLCEWCDKKKTKDLASKNHLYKRDISEWVWVCRSCHMKYDYKNGFRKGKSKR